MFTGIIQAVGRVISARKIGGDLRLEIDYAGLSAAFQPGDSIAVNGVCLTALPDSRQALLLDVSVESLSRTCLGALKAGSRVNLEPALTLSSPLGGHLVSGHVDGIGSVSSFKDDARSRRFRFSAPGKLSRYIAEKGSITVDGVSLTVNRVEDRRRNEEIIETLFDINIVPHTLNHTIMGQYQVDSRVHLEIDLIARYLERMLRCDNVGDEQTRIDRQLLARHGFIDDVND